MLYSQYLRIETAAGGLGCTSREFIRACHTKLSPLGKSHAQRKARHDWIRDGLKTLQRMRQQHRRFA